ncbi:MAG: histidinol-phosphate transaminase [Halobacteriales archaeon]
MQPRDLSSHATYRAGRGVEAVASELDRDPEALVALASNENPLGPSPKAVEAIRATASSVHRYPKASHVDLTAAIAEAWAVEPAQVWLANGGDGALDYLCRAMLEPGDGALVPEPGFAYYAMAARYHHGTVATWPLSRADDFAMDADAVLDAYGGERMVFLTSPHNPTGGRFAVEAVRTIAEATDEDTLVVVDEAYQEFADGESALALLGERDDVAVLRTFSKAYGLAGLRLGYALVPAAWADAYERVTTPFAAGELACRAGLAALDDDAHLERSVRNAREAREYYRAELDAPTWESHANFVLADVGDATAVAEAVRRQGVIVRDCTSFGLPGCVRVTCGTPEESERAVEALNAAVAEVGG